MATDPTEWLLRIGYSHVEKTRILCSLTPNEFYFGADSPVAPDIEPPPLLNYNAVHIMIGIGRQFLSKHDIKRWDYLADARTNYFVAHQNFYKAFHDLQDAQTYEKIMLERKAEIEVQIMQGEAHGTAKVVIDKKRRDLEDIACNLTKNRIQMPALAQAVREKAKVRDRTASWLSNMKSHLLERDFPALVYLMQQIFQNKQRYYQAKAAAANGKTAVHANAKDPVPEILRPGSDALGARGCDGALLNGNGIGLSVPSLKGKDQNLGNGAPREEDSQMAG